MRPRLRLSSSLALAALLLLLLLGEVRVVEAQRTWRVRAGDALSLIADRVGVSVDQLREWNAIPDDTIFVGQELRVGPGRTLLEHRIQPGDNATRIAARYGVTLRDLGAWNPGRDLDRIRAGRKLRVFVEEPESRSLSIGAPHDGTLARAVRLRPHPGYVIRDANRAWATQETARWLLEAFDAVRAAHPRAPKVRVHDISLRRGGRMSGHRSHQSGRDVDLSYYQRSCGRIPCPMWRLPPEQLDVERQWTLFEHWLRKEQVEAIFMDYGLQASLYRHAQRRGATRAQLHRWFQYPRGRAHPLGIIRHFPRHDDHAHVRFVCPESDADCR